MTVQGVDHLYVETRDLDRARAFWSALGLRVAAAWGEDGHRACRLEAGDTYVVLAEAERPVVPTAHFRVADAEALEARLAADPAVEVTVPLEATHWGSRWIRVRDPDGHEYALETRDEP